MSFRRSSPLRPGMRMSVMRTSGASERKAINTLSAWSKHFAAMPLPFSAFSSTHRIEASSSTYQTCSGFAFMSRGVHRQRDDEYGPARRAVEFDQTSVTADEVLRDAESQSRTVGAPRHQRIENS